MLSAKDVTLKYGLSRTSLIEYERQGLCNPVKTPGGHRRYTAEGIENLLKIATKKDFPILVCLQYEDYAILPSELTLIAGGERNAALREFSPDVDASILSQGIYIKTMPLLSEEQRYYWTYEGVQMKGHPHTVILKSKSNSTGIWNTNNDDVPKYEIKDKYLNFIQIVDDINAQTERYWHQQMAYRYQEKELASQELIPFVYDFPPYIYGMEYHKEIRTILPVRYKWLGDQ